MAILLPQYYHQAYHFTVRYSYISLCILICTYIKHLVFLKNVICKHIHGNNGTLLSPCTLIYNAILQNIPLHLSPFIYIYMLILYILAYKIIYLLSPSICLYKTIIPSKYLIRVTCVPETQMNKDANEDGWELVMNRKQRRIDHNIHKWETFKQMNPTSTTSSNSSITPTTLTSTTSYSETGKII